MGDGLVLAVNLKSDVDTPNSSYLVFVEEEAFVHQPAQNHRQSTNLRTEQMEDFQVSLGAQVSAVARVSQLDSDMILIAGASSQGAAIATVHQTVGQIELRTHNFSMRHIEL